MPETTAITATFPLETFVMLAMYFVVAIYTIYTGVFYYHWKSYGTDPKITGLTLLVYGIVTAPLIMVIIGLALFF